MRTKACADCGVAFAYKQKNRLRCDECQVKRHKLLQKASERIRQSTPEYRAKRRIYKKELTENNRQGIQLKWPPLTKYSIDQLFRAGIGNTILDSDCLIVGYTAEEIDKLRLDFPDSMYPSKSTIESYCGCSLFSGVLPFKKSFAL